MKSAAGKSSQEMQCKIVEKIDKLMEAGIHRIFYEQSIEFNVDMASLKKWYMQLGKLDIFDSQEQSEEDVAMKKIEAEVLDFIRKSPGCKRLKTYNHAYTLIRKMGVTHLEGHKFGTWINGLIDNHCDSVYDTITIKPDPVRMKPSPPYPR